MTSRCVWPAATRPQPTRPKPDFRSCLDSGRRGESTAERGQRLPMHGLIHLELRKFVEANYGAPAWSELVQRAKVDNEVYTPMTSYPDEQMMALVTEAVKLTGLSATGCFTRPM